MNVFFKLLLIVGLALILRVYLTSIRTGRRDRFIVVLLFVVLVGAVIYPETTTWIANRLGVGRGVDLAFYVAFLLLFFLASVFYARYKELQRSMTIIVREIAILKARRGL